MQKFIGAFSLLGLLLSNVAVAQWELDSSRSTLDFVSIKNDTVAEIHQFTSLVGSIGADGQVQVSIDLASAETNIETRNTRLDEMLFEVASFPTASVTAQVSPEVMTAAVGGLVSTELDVELSLHGASHTYTAAVTVVAQEGGHLRVLSSRPVLVNTKDFGLTAGVDALRQAAGLKAISYAVPVTLNLVFVSAPQ